jgi:hypothetical protein
MVVFDAVDDDCDDLTYYVIDNGGAIGPAWFNDDTLFYMPVEGDFDVYQMVVGVTDGELSDENCSVMWNIICCTTTDVVIEAETGSSGKGVIQGQFADVEIGLPMTLFPFGMGGFNFLLAYDAAALSFQSAEEGAIYDSCAWEYFTYRYGPDGNCGNACPSGLVRIAGIAETNNGASHPICVDPEYLPIYWDDTLSLATLTFLVSNDRSLECQFIPIRFYWTSCGDNTLSDADGVYLFLQSNTFDYGATEYSFEVADSFPSYIGAPNICLIGDKTIPIRHIDFYNGGIQIICADSIDARGDINLNGVAYEIADAVLLTNYHVNGLGVFANPEASTAASDVNADGVPLTVADLVYLIRVVVGDADPYSKSTPVIASYTVSNGELSLDTRVGAVLVVYEGNSAPVLLAENVEMQYAYDGVVTRALVYSLEPNHHVSGDILRSDGNLISIDAATYFGQPVVFSNTDVPASFALGQNYPNPFNNRTVISYTVPVACHVTLEVFNVAGQKLATLVDEFVGPGEYRADWDASDFASGLYLYRITTGNYTETRKALYIR